MSESGTAERERALREVDDDVQDRRLLAFERCLDEEDAHERNESARRVPVRDRPSGLENTAQSPTLGGPLE
jgi:hypothetical protein